MMTKFNDLFKKNTKKTTFGVFITLAVPIVGYFYQDIINGATNSVANFILEMDALYTANLVSSDDEAFDGDEAFVGFLTTVIPTVVMLWLMIRVLLNLLNQRVFTKKSGYLLVLLLLQVVISGHPASRYDKKLDMMDMFNLGNIHAIPKILAEISVFIFSKVGIAIDGENIIKPTESRLYATNYFNKHFLENIGPAALDSLNVFFSEKIFGVDSSMKNIHYKTEDVKIAAVTRKIDELMKILPIIRRFFIGDISLIDEDAYIPMPFTYNISAWTAMTFIGIYYCLNRMESSMKIEHDIIVDNLPKGTKKKFIKRPRSIQQDYSFLFKSALRTL